jgi:leucyl-tRNA synthetase
LTHFESNGTEGLKANASFDGQFTAEEWVAFSEVEKESILQDYRLAFRSLGTVNWCPELGTVLANDEIKDGLSERGGHPVVKKKMWGWSMRVSAYADRLLLGLDELDWSPALKEQQKNWIGKSKGAKVFFQIKNHEKAIEVFTTRPDTIYGVTFMTLAPESELLDTIVSDEYRKEVEDYINIAKNRSERERQTEVKNITGVFTGAYATHPLTGEAIPIWVGDYVLGSYGTGAVMAVPAHDSRDFAFAKHFRIPIRQVISKDGSESGVLEEAFEEKGGILINSELLNGQKVKDATKTILKELYDRGIGEGRTNYRLRDAAFSRQRYWGEPIPIYYENGIAKGMELKDLPLNLPEVDQYKPTESGEPPLARSKDWFVEGNPIEASTMPGWAGSSWYLFRYMDARNSEEFASEEALNYWKNVDLYIGGSEHATGHLIYSRFWTKFLYDRGHIQVEEPFRKLVNQGMILGRSNFVYRLKESNTFVSHNLKDQYDTVPMHVDVNIVNDDVLDTEAFKSWREDLAEAEFILEDGVYLCGSEVEKMSKSKFNVVNPDVIVEQYGADTLRMYEMFLGPIDQSKPWNTSGISGVYNFLKKFWRLFHQGDAFSVSEEVATADELKVLHKTIKKAQEDVEAFSFNTSVSSFMVCVNELQKLKCNKRVILEDLVVILSPYAPHICEELWEKLGHANGVLNAEYPKYNEAHLVESLHKYPVSFNGKMRFTLDLPITLTKEEIETEVLKHEKTQQYLGGNSPKKIVVVPKRIVNFVV